VESRFVRNTYKISMTEGVSVTQLRRKLHKMVIL